MTETGSQHRVRWVASAVGLVVVALIAVLAVGSGSEANEASDVLGRRVPEVSGETLQGTSYDIDNARGEWVVVNFFATWCPGCINEHPELVAFDAWAAETGQAEVVAVVFNDDVDDVASFFAANGGGWPVLDRPDLALDFQVSQIPETFLVAPSGQVVQHIQGEVTFDALRAAVEGG